MTHLGLGSSLEDPWGDLVGGVVVVLSSRETVLFSWEAWVALCLLEHLRPCLPDLFDYLIDLFGGGIVSFPRGRESSGRIAAFPGRKDSNCLGGLPAMGELLPSLGG